MKNFNVDYWYDENARDLGESDTHDSFDNVDDAIVEAKRIYFNNDFPVVEVRDNQIEKTYFHISVDVPEGTTDV